MANFQYLYIGQNNEPQTDEVKQKYPNDLKGTLFLKGDCFCNGQSIFNDATNEKKRLYNIFGKKHKFTSSLSPDNNWSVEEFTAELWGTWLCIKMRLRAKTAIAEGNLSNQTILAVDLFTKGAVKNIMNTSFTNAGSGPVCSFYTNKKNVQNQRAQFSIVCTATGSPISAGTEISANFAMPVALNYMAFPLDD